MFNRSISDCSRPYTKAVNYMLASVVQSTHNLFSFEYCFALSAQGEATQLK